MCIALSLTSIYKQFDSQGKMGGFNGNVLKFTLLHNGALSWCKSKHTVCLVMPGWAGSSQAHSHEGFVVFGVLPFCLPARGWIHGLLSSCAAAVTGTASLTRQGDALSVRQRERERSFLQHVQSPLWNNEVAKESGNGGHTGRDHLYLCLTFGCSHWHPVRR